MLTKKGQFHQAWFLGVIGVVITLIFIGIIFASSQRAMVELRDVAENQIGVIPNETITWVGNNSAISLTQNKLGIIGSSVLVYNNGSLVNQGGNYTINVEGSSITIINISGNGGSLWGVGQGQIVTNKINISYNYFFGSQERNITDGAREGVKTLQDFQPTWGAIVATALVIVLITALSIFLFSKMSNY